VFDVDPQNIKGFFYERGRKEALSRVGWWILLRWVLLGVTVLTTLTGNQFLNLNLPSANILWLCIAIALLNALLHYKLFTLKKASSSDFNLVDRINYLQFGADLFFLAGIFHQTGGIASPLLLYFVFHVILGGVMQKRIAGVIYVALAAAIITILTYLEFVGFIPHAYRSSFISPDIQDNPFFVLLLLFFFLMVLFISSALVSALLKRLRERITQLIELQEKLNNTNQRLETLNQIAKETLSTLGLNPRLDFICGCVRDLMEVKGATIRLLDERTNRLRLVSACGLSDDYIKKGPVDADKSLGRALKGEPHLVLDVASDSSVQYPQEALKEGIVSMLSLPLKGREKVIGALRLYTSEKREFTQEEIDFLSALASQGAISIEDAKLYDALKRQDEAKHEFILLMTHELKAPLTAIQGFLDVMQKGYVGNLTDKQQELIERMQKRIDSFLEVSTGLLDIYQWQSKGIEQGWTQISFKEQILKAEDLFKIIAQKKGITIQFALPEEEVTVRATEEELEKVLNNLISNAIKYTPSGGSVFVTLTKDAKWVILRIKDTGIGISTEDLPKLFVEFFRTKEAKTVDPSGRGLGLAFVKKIVESLGGTIRGKSDNAKGAGTEFVVTLPRA